MQMDEKLRFLYDALGDCGIFALREELKDYLVNGILRGGALWAKVMSEEEFNETMEFALKNGIISIDKCDFVTAEKNIKEVKMAKNESKPTDILELRTTLRLIDHQLHEHYQQNSSVHNELLQLRRKRAETVEKIRELQGPPDDGNG